MMEKLNALILETNYPIYPILQNLTLLKPVKILNKNGKIYLYFIDTPDNRKKAFKLGNQLWQNGLVEDFYLKIDAILNLKNI